MADRTAYEEARKLLAARRQTLVESSLPQLPPAPESLEATGLNETLLTEIVVKLLYLRGNLTGRQICEIVRLPFGSILEPILKQVREDGYAAVRSGSSVSPLDWEMYITDKGSVYARECIDRNGYAGPAPVPLKAYVDLASRQAPEWQRLNKQHVRAALQGMVVSDQMIMKLGPAFNSGRSMFLYGHAGNGKTLISEKMAVSMRGGMLLPYAVEAGGQVVQLFDPTHHQVLTPDEWRTRGALDQRWMVVNRPFIIAGGELQMGDLEMTWDSNRRHYIAPLQMKANGGVFMIDDFGRQQMPARDLLNRWIVPLEKRYDYHLLSGGVQMQVPFNLLIIFSTNLDPKDLVEEAFLRRIKYKIDVGDPTEEQFREIFVNYCREVGVEYRPEMLAYLIQRHYRETGRGFRATHPRDLINQLIDVARFNELPIELTEKLLDAAAETYFVDLG